MDGKERIAPWRQVLPLILAAGCAAPAPAPEGTTPATTPIAASTPSRAKETPAAPGDHASRFLADLASQAQAAEEAGTSVITGKDGFLFFVPELRSLGAGRFWGEAASRVSRATSPEAQDPLPAILDFREQLERQGIELLFVPVPAKAVIYPEMISDVVELEKGGQPPRLDAEHHAFLETLAENGVKTVDLVPAFLEHRFDPEGAVFCKQDTHWSGRGSRIAASEIAGAIRRRAWAGAVAKKRFETDTREVEIAGDLWRLLPEPRPEKERLALVFGGERVGSQLQAAAPWRESPVLLLADSHGLVFHAGGDKHAVGAGLADHLALELGFAVDLVAVRGSGATPARVNLLRRGDNLAGKKLVVWCLSVREYTEGQGWKKVPVVR